MNPSLQARRTSDQIRVTLRTPPHILREVVMIVIRTPKPINLNKLKTKLLVAARGTQ